MKGDEIDDAIDAVVRQIMRTEPPAGLRARVMSQLAAPARGAVLAMPRLAAAAAFAVCLVAGFVVTRDRTAPLAEPAGTVEIATGTSAAPPAETPPSSSAPHRPEPPRREATGVVLADESARRLPVAADDQRLVSAMSIDEPPLAVSIAPLRPMTPITAAPLDSLPVRIRDIAIHPLELEPVQIDPSPSTPR